MSTTTSITNNFLLDIPFSELNEDSFRQNLLLAERPAVIRGAATSTATPNPFTRCLPLFSSFEAMETVACGPNFDLEKGSPEVASNAFMSCDRKMYRDIPVDSVKTALNLVKRQKSSSGQQQEMNDDENEEQSASFYMKLPLPSSPKILQELRLEEFLLKPEHQVTWCEHPMLLKPGSCFAWLYVGQRGSSSPSHVDIMGSDAVLACFAGLKEWAMCHPFDKHLIMSKDGSEMADLFNIDHKKFPQAKFARITFFEQRPGDVVFTPGNAPHAVRNLEDSISITFNFLDKATGAPKASQFLAFTMKHREESTKTLPATFTFRLFSPSYRTDLRLRAPQWGAGWPLPTDEWTWRSSAGLPELHSAAEPIRKAVSSTPAAPSSLMALRALGATVHEWDFCVDYFFETKSDQVLIDITKKMNGDDVSQTSFCSAKWPLQQRINNCFSDPVGERLVNGEEVELEPEIRFPQLDSHFGRFTAFPPLCACLGFSWYFDSPNFADVFPLIKEMRKSLAENFGQPTMWHYSRFPFNKTAAAANSPAADFWCKTQLFYSSPSIDGPVSLYPLLEDGTLLKREPLMTMNSSQTEKVTSPSSSSSTTKFFPHFVKLSWNIDKLMKNFSNGSLCPIQILDFGVILQQKLISEIYMKLDAFQQIVDTAHAIGLDDFPNDAKACVDCGMEKVLAVLMHLTARPGVVGFRYTHTFSAVREPDTLCLIGCAASYLLAPTFDNDVAITKSSKRLEILLQALCEFVKGPFDESQHEDDPGVLAGKSMEILSNAFCPDEVEEETIEGDEKKSEAQIKAKVEEVQQKFQFIKKTFESLEKDLTLQQETINAENEDDEGYQLMQKQMLRFGLIKAAVQHFESLF